MSGEFMVDSVALGGLERTVGFLLSMSATVLGTWVIARHQTTAPSEDFAQARRIAIVATAIFTALMFVFLAGPKRFMELGVIAVGALVACFLFFLWNVATAYSAKKGVVPEHVSRPTMMVVTYLATFIIYAASGSVAISAAGLLLYVADPTGPTTPAFGAPSTPAAGDAAVISSPTIGSPPALPSPTTGPARPSISEKITADLVPAPTGAAKALARAPAEYEVRNFEVSSGQVNIGCEETQSARASFLLPEGAEIVGTLSASWRNTANAKSSSVSTRHAEGNKVVAEGAIVGLPREHILGVANCPGGGHGELVLSGAYRQAQKGP